MSCSLCVRSPPVSERFETVTSQPSEDSETFVQPFKAFQCLPKSAPRTRGSHHTGNSCWSRIGSCARGGLSLGWRLQDWWLRTWRVVLRGCAKFLKANGNFPGSCGSHHTGNSWRGLGSYQKHWKVMEMQHVKLIKVVKGFNNLDVKLLKVVKSY